MSVGYREPAKVVIIKTHYVETDAVRFKSVVQKFTGKDSTVVAAKASESKVLKARRAGPRNFNLELFIYLNLIK